MLPIHPITVISIANGKAIIINSVNNHSITSLTILFLPPLKKDQGTVDNWTPKLVMHAN